MSEKNINHNDINDAIKKWWWKLFLKHSMEKSSFTQALYDSAIEFSNNCKCIFSDYVKWTIWVSWQKFKSQVMNILWIHWRNNEILYIKFCELIKSTEDQTSNILKN